MNGPHNSARSAEREFGPIEAHLFAYPRRGAECAIKPVSPGMIGILEDFALPAFRADEDRTTVATDIHEGSYRATLIARDDDRHSAYVRGEECTECSDLLRQADLLPGAPEDLLLLACEPLLLGVPGPGRVQPSSRVAPRSGSIACRRISSSIIRSFLVDAAMSRSARHSIVAILCDSSTQLDHWIVRLERRGEG